MLGLAIIPFLREGPRRGRTGASFLVTLRVALSQRGFVLLCLATFLAEMGYVTLGIAVPLVGGAFSFATDTIAAVFVQVTDGGGERYSTRTGSGPGWSAQLIWSIRTASTNRVHRNACNDTPHRR